MSDNDREIFDRLNKTETRLGETNGKLEIIIAQNERLIKIISTALRLSFFVIFVELAALIYGALGAEGFKAVTHTATAGVANG